MFRIADARAVPEPVRGDAGVRVRRGRAAVPAGGGGHRAHPGRGGAVITPTAQRMVRALAIIEAFSYWKALCSPVIEVALPRRTLPNWTGGGVLARGDGGVLLSQQIDYTVPGSWSSGPRPARSPPALPATSGGGGGAAAGDVQRRQGFARARPHRRRPGRCRRARRLLPVQPGGRPACAAWPVAGGRGAAWRSARDPGRVAAAERGGPPQRAHALLRLSGVRRDARRLPARQRARGGGQLAQRRRAERAVLSGPPGEPPVDQELRVRGGGQVLPGPLAARRARVQQPAPAAVRGADHRLAGR